MAAILGGDISKVVGWLEGQVLGNFKLDQVLDQLPPAVRDAVTELAKEQTSVHLDLGGLAQLAKRKATKLTRAANARLKTVENVTQGLATPLSGQDRDALLEERKQLQKKAKKTVTPRTAEERKIEFSQLAARFKQAKAVVDAYVPPEPEDPKVAASREKLNRVLRLIAEHEQAAGEKAVCMVCGTQKGPEERSIWQGRVEASLSRLPSPPESDFAAASNYRETLARMERMKARIRELAALIKEQEVAADPSERIQQITEALAADDAVRQAWQNAKAERVVSANDKVLAANLKTARASLEEAAKTLVDERKRVFTEKVGQYLHHETLGVDLASGRLGFIRDGALHTGLSGAERSEMLLALGSAVADPSTPSLLVPEDRGWSSDKLTEVMTALSACPVQVVLVSTVHPTEVPDEWTIVSLES
jgi:hypothetical protein